ncbi:MAG: hypothetical protein QM753_13200 [Thermomicrobiales bacterium]
MSIVTSSSSYGEENVGGDDGDDPGEFLHSRTWPWRSRSRPSSFLLDEKMIVTIVTDGVVPGVVECAGDDAHRQASPRHRHQGSGVVSHRSRRLI